MKTALQRQSAKPGKPVPYLTQANSSDPIEWIVEMNVGFTARQGSCVMSQLLETTFDRRPMLRLDEAILNLLTQVRRERRRNTQ